MLKDTECCMDGCGNINCKHCNLTKKDKMKPSQKIKEIRDGLLSKDNKDPAKYNGTYGERAILKYLDEKENRGKLITIPERFIGRGVGGAGSRGPNGSGGAGGGSNNYRFPFGKGGL